MNPKKRPTIPIFNRVRLLRAERDMTRAQLAARVDVNPQTIGALERGDHSPSLDLAMRICEVFELPVEAVFSRKQFEPTSITADDYAWVNLRSTWSFGLIATNYDERNGGRNTTTCRQPSFSSGARYDVVKH